MDAHQRRVDNIAHQLRSASGSVHIAKAGVHHVVPLPQDSRFSSAPVDTSSLTNIVSVDPGARRAVIEPGVSFEQLVRATLPLGLAPKTVPELRGITAGGAVSGCSVESLSYRYGGFHDSCTTYEVVGGDGTIHLLHRGDELFERVHGSYGTLGILTQIECELIEAKPFVEINYQHFTSYAPFRETLTAACDYADSDEALFVDAIVFGPTHLTLCLGRFVDTCGEPSVYSGSEIFYKSAERLTSDTMSTEEYFFRYDRECHWLTATVPPLQWPRVRQLIGNRVLGSTNLIALSNKFAPILRLAKRRPDLVCDIFIPSRNFDEFWQWYCEVFNFWPLWVIPYRLPTKYPWLSEELREGLTDGELFIDCAVYGKPNSHRNVDFSVLLEDKTYELGGIKTLIGRNHYTQERFWHIYDRDGYDRAKAVLDPTRRFPNLFDKLGNVD